MGLDFVEIMLEIEERFDVVLSEDDIEERTRDRDMTVGDLYHLVLAKLHLRDVARHDFRLNFALWRELQGTTHVVTRVPPDRIELKTPLETLFPRKTRRAAWETLRETSAYRIQKLDYPRVARTTGFVLAAVVVLVEQFRIWQIPGAKWLWPLLGIFGLWMFVETHAKVLSILSPLRNVFPSGMTTVKDFCRVVLATNYEDICGRNSSMTVLSSLSCPF